jgi:GH24 family phage-related lysozyme (muramidase)
MIPLQRTNAEGLRLIEEEEAFIPFVYDDFVEPRSSSDYAREWKGGPVKGTLTIGYGTTSPATRLRQGTRVDRVTAEAWLAEDLRQAERDVARLVDVPLNSNQYSALVSFVYNVGPGALQKSTLRRLLNAGNYDAVPRELNKFVNAKGVRLKGLVRRRAREGALWSKSVRKAELEEIDAPLTETDPDVPLATTRPDAVPDKTPVESRTLQATGGGIAATALTVLGYVTDIRVLMVVGVLAIVGAYFLIGRERIQRFVDERILSKPRPA